MVPTRCAATPPPSPGGWRSTDQRAASLKFREDAARSPSSGAALARRPCWRFTRWLQPVSLAAHAM